MVVRFGSNLFHQKFINVLNADSFLRKLFFGDTDFAKPRLILFWHSPLVLGSPAGGVWGGMRASKKETGLNHCLSHFSAMYCPSLKGMHPRHPPRAFPLWLLALRCLRAGKPALLRERKSPLPGSGDILLVPRRAPAPHPLHAFHISVYLLLRYLHIPLRLPTALIL